MKTYVLSQMPRLPLAYLELRDDLERRRAQKGKVYTTYVRLEGCKKYDFVTTSKDLNLELSLMTERGQFGLARLIEELRMADSADALLLQIEEDRSTILVVRTEGPDRITFTLSPAH